MASDEDLEEILGGARRELFHAEVLEDEQIDLRERLDQGPAFTGGFGEVLDEVEGPPGQDAAPRTNRAERESGRDVRRG